jgi:predicted amidohydrolase YtcJ
MCVPTFYGRIFDGRRLWPAASLHVSGGVVEGLAAGEIPGATRLGPDDLLTPGFLDGHLHFTSWCEARRRLDLTGLPRGEAERALAEAARRGTGWLVGRGFTVDTFGGWPDADLLERLVPGRPAAIWALDGHSLWLNRTALRAVPAAEAARRPGGATQDRDGEPAGVFFEEAAKAVAAAIPPTPWTERLAGLAEGMEALFALGVVGAVTYEDEEGLRLLTAFYETPRPLRLFVFLYADAVGARTPGEIRPGLSLVGAKWFLDGTLGSATAWMKAPYADGGHGVSRLTPELPGQVAALRARGFLPSLHAIGDRAAAAALDILGEGPGRIEHLQLVDPADLPRFSGGLAASVQPCHLVADRAIVGRVWGEERAARSYAYRSLAATGAILAFGSDAPIWSPDPRDSLAMAVDRRLGPDEDPFRPEEAVDLETALAAFTSGVGRSVGRPEGRLAPGQPATFTVWRGLAPGRFREATPVVTYVGGKEVAGA